MLLNEGTAEADREENIVVAPQGKIELSNRYRDAPRQKDHDWMKFGTNVAAGLMVAGGIAALAAGGVLLLGAAAATAAKMVMTVFLADWGKFWEGACAWIWRRTGWKCCDAEVSQ